jgi:hypothetical protein
MFASACIPPARNFIRLLNGTFERHSSRNAAAIGIRAARIAGNKPPINPMSAAHTMPRTSNAGVTLKANVIWLKL